MLNSVLIKFNIIFHFLFFILVFFTQFSYIANEVIDWDESTFFVISKYLADGSLLYVDYWDGKPPIIFVYLGFIFKIFGSSLIIGRLAGDIIIFLNVVLIFEIINKSFSKLVALSSSLLLIYLFSFEFSQPTMTEHLGVLFIILCFYHINRNPNSLNYYYLGILFSFAFNTRNNLAFGCLGIIIYLYIENKFSINSILKLMFGFLTPVTLIGAYFAFYQKLNNYIYMLIEFPIQNATNRMSFNLFVNEIYSRLKFEDGNLIEIIITIFLFLIFLYILLNFSYSSIPNILKINIFIFLFLTLSIIAGGRLSSHYYIQLLPFLAVFFAYAFSFISKKKYLLFLVSIFTLYVNLNSAAIGVQNFIRYETILINYPVKNVSEYLNNLNLNDIRFLALENHIIYLYNSDIKPFKIVHPSNLPNPDTPKEMLTSLTKLNLTINDEFNLYVNNRPDFIFCEKECYQYIDKNVFKNYYKLVLEIDGIKLFQNIS